VADRHAELRAMLRTLKLPAMAAAFPELALKAAKGGQTHETFLYDLVQCECVQRDERRIARLLHRSGLPQEKTFATLALDRFPLPVRQQLERLQSGAFVEEATNVIAVGRPGTGKSHLAAALGHALVVQGQAVRWSTTAQLVQQLLAAKRDLRLPQVLAQLDRFACLILDDIGYVQHDRDEMEVLFTLLAERYERRSVVITTNLVFSEWTRIFKDPMTTMAAVDRVVHHAVILDLMGLESYRVKEANAQQAQRTNGATEHEPVHTSKAETVAVRQGNRQV
jgi:DNA replication protein DnaC